MSYRAEKQVITAQRPDTQTDAANDNTRRPKLSSGKNNSRVDLLWVFSKGVKI